MESRKTLPVATTPTHKNMFTTTTTTNSSKRKLKPKLASSSPIIIIRADRVSHESRQWLAQCGLTVERLAAQIEPVYLPERKIYLYHCDHRGLPLALISSEGATEWRGEYDEWGNQLNEENPHHLFQPYRLPGQQYDEESGLCYNRHRYYNPLQGRYITQDPIGLAGGWNSYKYSLNPVINIDPLGLDDFSSLKMFVSAPGIQSQLSDAMYGQPKPVSLRPDGQPWGYGCGSEGSDWFVPDGLWGGSFMDACRNHDKCYETKGNDKTTCDSNLGSDIALACDVLKNKDPRYNDSYNQCLMVSAIYRFAVGGLGGGAYEAAQAASN